MIIEQALQWSPKNLFCNVQAPKPLLMCKRLNRHRNTKVTEISTDLDTGAPNVVATTRTSHAVRRSLSSVSQANRQKRWTGNKKGWMQIIPELFSQARCPSSWSTPPSPASLNTFVPSSAKSQLSRWDLCNLKIWKIFVTSWVPDQDTKVKWRRL